jgi:hypothetical protein
VSTEIGAALRARIPATTGDDASDLLVGGELRASP